MAKRILLLGATGTIGRAALVALSDRGHDIVCPVRNANGLAEHFPHAQFRQYQIDDPASLLDQGFGGEHFDAVISCIASRNGLAADAWTVDYRANLIALEAAQRAAVRHFILLSSICVQKPLLAFQQAKLAFEQALIASDMPYSIVRPTAYFKSLSGQVERVRKGKPFLVFGDGQLTACKPVSDRDVAEFLANCVEKDEFINRILPVGGPGEAITPLRQGEMLFGLLDQKPRFRHVPVGLLDAIAAMLQAAGSFSAKAAQKAELARIGRYYATESMLLLNPASGRYDAAATPSIGNDLLEEHYRRLIHGETAHESTDHSIF